MSSDEWKISVGALFENPHHDILLVRPTYKPSWDLPGGILNPGEEPRQGLRRELKEELSLDMIHVDDIICVDYILSDWEDLPVIMLMFSCRADLTQDLIPDGVEISDVGFYPVATALTMVSKNMNARLRRVYGKSLQIYSSE